MQNMDPGQRLSTAVHTWHVLAPIISHNHVNPHPADHHYFRFLFVLLMYQITVIGNELAVYTSIFAITWCQVKQKSNFQPLGVVDRG